MRRRKLLGIVSVLALIATMLTLTGTVGAASDATSTSGAVASDPVMPSSFEGDLRDLPLAADPASAFDSVPRLTEPVTVTPAPRPVGNDPLLAIQAAAPERAVRTLSGPDLSFAGIPSPGGFPPDTVGEVGKNHYIQMVNASRVAIYGKNGFLLAGPFLLESLWTAGGSCANGRGDPIVLYDHLADRWIMSEFATVGNHLCVYVSQTTDPTNGGWWLYDFPTPNFPDYPKYAVWPDAYYVSSNETGPSAAYALDRVSMLAGLPATSQRFAAPDLAGFSFQALIPADLDGPAPPAGSPGIFMRHRDDEVHNAGSNNPALDFLEMWFFSVDWANPANSTFTGPTDIPVTEFDSDLCGLVSFFCFPQPGTANTLDPLREVIMWRLQYRNVGPHQMLLGNFVTDVTGADQGGIRWFELRNFGASWSLSQEGTFAPDTDSRWMGSIAMDTAGNIALGYSVSSTTTFPSIRYTGRLAGDPAGTMTQGEFTILAGTASQTASTRWGDYSSMNVDPIDGCTFWYTNEVSTAAGTWATQIGRFRFSTCSVPRCDGEDATVLGTAAGDTLVGTPGDDVIVGLGGADTLRGNDGNDRLCGGSGTDLLYGGIGDDFMAGGSAGDELRGNDGNDTLKGGAAADLLLGGSGNDELSGADGPDDLRGGRDDDTLLGGSGNDSLQGDPGFDVLRGGQGTDTCASGEDNGSCEL